MARGVSSVWRTAEYCVEFCLVLDIVEIQLRFWKQRRSLGYVVEELRRLLDTYGLILQGKCSVVFCKFRKLAFRT